MSECEEHHKTGSIETGVDNIVRVTRAYSWIASLLLIKY